MHVGTKRLAFLGLLLALTVLSIILSSVIETGTIFFLAAGSYLVGVALIETTVSYGVAFYIASVCLALILAPNKIYCLTFAAMAFYLIIVEAIKRSMINQEVRKLSTSNSHSMNMKSKTMILWIIKFVIFNVIYVPILIFAPSFIYAGEIKPLMYLGLFIGGQVGFILYDLAFAEFIIKYWKRIRKNF